MLVILKVYSPVFDDSVGHRALRVDEGRNVQVLVAAEVRGGAVQQQQGEALEVMVGGAACYWETGHPGEDPHDVLRVHTELAEELEEDSYNCGKCEVGQHLHPGVEAPLTHDGERRAEVGLAAVRVSSGL